MLRLVIHLRLPSRRCSFCHLVEHKPFYVFFFLFHPVECQLDPSPVVICVSCSVSYVDAEASDSSSFTFSTLLFPSLGGTWTVLCFLLIHPVECQLDPSPVVICVSCSVSAVDAEATDSSSALSKSSLSSGSFSRIQPCMNLWKHTAFALLIVVCGVFILTTWNCFGQPCVAKKNTNFLSHFMVFLQHGLIEQNLVFPINILHNFVIVLNYFWFLRCFIPPVFLFCLHNLLCAAQKQALHCSYLTILVPQLSPYDRNWLLLFQVSYFSPHFLRNSSI